MEVCRAGGHGRGPNSSLPSLKSGHCDSRAPSHLRFVLKRQMTGMHSKNSYPRENYLLGPETCSEPDLESAPSVGSALI